MRKLLLLFAYFAITFIACKKDNVNPNEVSVVGSWHLFSVIYSLAEHTPTDSIVLILDASGHYKETTNDTVTATGSYSVKLQQLSDSTSQTFINYVPDSGDAYSSAANRYKDTLVLQPQVFSTDGYELKYKKQ